MIEALLFTPGDPKTKSVKFDTLVLRFSATNEWAEAVWELVIETSTKQFPAASIEEISSLAECYDATVIDGRGVSHGPFSIQTVICGYPSHTFCFLFHVDAGGMWSGHSVTRSFGESVVVPYRTDPT